MGLTIKGTIPRGTTFFPMKATWTRHKQFKRSKWLGCRIRPRTVRRSGSRSFGSLNTRVRRFKFSECCWKTPMLKWRPKGIWPLQPRYLLSNLFERELQDAFGNKKSTRFWQWQLPLTFSHLRDDLHIPTDSFLDLFSHAAVFAVFALAMRGDEQHHSNDAHLTSKFFQQEMCRNGATNFHHRKHLFSVEHRHGEGVAPQITRPSGR